MPWTAPWKIWTCFLHSILEVGRTIGQTRSMGSDPTHVTPVTAVWGWSPCCPRQSWCFAHPFSSPAGVATMGKGISEYFLKHAILGNFNTNWLFSEHLTLKRFSWQVELIYKDHHYLSRNVRKYNQRNCLKLPSNWIQVLGTKLTKSRISTYLMLSSFTKSKGEKKNKTHKLLLSNPLARW